MLLETLLKRYGNRLYKGLVGPQAWLIDLLGVDMLHPNEIRWGRVLLTPFWETLVCIPLLFFFIKSIAQAFPYQRIGLVEDNG